MGETLQFVAFRVDTQHFAIEIHRVTEVIALCDITPLPGMPPFLEGMIDLRGQIVPVVDMRKRLGAKNTANTMQTRILVARIHRKKTGLIVDEADQVLTIPVENIQPPPEHSSEFVMAVAKQGNLLFVILDLERLMNRQEQLHLERMTLPQLHARGTR